MNAAERALLTHAPDVFDRPKAPPTGAPELGKGGTIERARAYLAAMGPAIEGQGGDVHTFKAACALVVDFALSDLDAGQLLAEWNAQCVPPWDMRDLDAKIRSARRSGRHTVGEKLGPGSPSEVPVREVSATVTAATTTRTPIEWPAPLSPVAYHGVIGELVRAVEPHTEADPAALLTQALLILGNIIGPIPHFRAEGSQHRLVLYCVIVGLTSKGRKGSSYNSVMLPFRAVDDTLTDPDRVVPGGMASGEGLIWAVRDPIMRGSELEDPGISDKRRLVVESEFARVLQTFNREGSTLSAVIRECWDSGTLGTLTKTNRAKASGAHISIIGHITRDELRRYLSATEAGNGFGNRFLWVCAKRSKLLPEGGALHTVDFGGLCRRLCAAVDFARGAGELRRDDAARAFWATIYPDLSEGHPGMLGAMTSRAEAQVMRLACLYALGDMSYVVTIEHLKAALEVWRYCYDSARFIFGASLGDPVADELDGALLRAGGDGLSRTEIRDIFGRNRASHDIGRALTLLQEHGRVRRTEDRSGQGRPVERWVHLRLYDINDLSSSNGTKSVTTYDKSPEAPCSEASS